MSISEADLTFEPLPATDCLSKDDMVDRFMCLMIEQGFYDRCGDIDERSGIYSALTGEEYSVDFIRELESVLTMDDRTIPLGVLKQIERSEEEKFIKGSLHFFSLTGAKDYQEFDSLFAGVIRYDCFIDLEDYTTAPDSVQQQIVGVLKAIETLEAESSLDRDSVDHPVMRLTVRNGAMTWRLFRENALHFLVMEQPENAEAIARVAARYQTNDRSVILGIMNGIEPAIAGGAL